MNRQPSKPSRKEINPFDNLDGRVAERNWYGLDVGQGAELLAKNSSKHQEDLMFMGAVAFNYYAESILIYIRSEDSAWDATFISSISNMIGFRFDEIDSLHYSVFYQILDYIDKNPHKFYASGHPYLARDLAIIKSLGARLSNLMGVKR